MKKAIVILLSALMLISASAVWGCGDTSVTQTDATSAPASADTTAAPAETELRSAVLPDNLSFPGEEVRILSRGSDGVKDEVWAEEVNGDLVNDKIYRRNSDVESRLGVTLKSEQIAGTDNYAVTERLRTAVTSGDNEFDVTANSTYSTIMYTGENLFKNLLDCAYLDLDAPYWSQGFNESASIGSAQYLATGAIAITLYRYMFVTFFNVKTMSDAGQESLFDVVSDGRWTLEYQKKLSDDLYSDTNGDGIIDSGDTFGFASNGLSYIDPYWSSCDVKILSKDQDNWLVYDLDVERLTAMIDKVIDLYYNSKSSIEVSGTDASYQDRLTTMFSADETATTTLRLIAVETEKLRDMPSEYGIIPMPKLDTDQNEYHTFVHDQFTSFGIAGTVSEDRVDMIGAVLELMALESYKTVVPEYYSNALKGRYLRNSQSWEMLDMIYDGIRIDAGVLYTKSLNSVHQQPRTIVTSKVNTAASFFKASGKVIEKQLDKLQSDLMAIQQ